MQAFSEMNSVVQLRVADVSRLFELPFPLVNLSFSSRFLIRGGACCTRWVMIPLRRLAGRLPLLAALCALAAPTISSVATATQGPFLPKSEVVVVQGKVPVLDPIEAKAVAFTTATNSKPKSATKSAIKAPQKLHPKLRERTQRQPAAQGQQEAQRKLRRKKHLPKLQSPRR